MACWMRLTVKREMPSGLSPKSAKGIGPLIAAGWATYSTGMDPTYLAWPAVRQSYAKYRRQ